MNMEWDANRHALHAGAMDDAHRSLLNLIGELAQAKDSEEFACLERLCLRCDEHIQQEDAWMKATAVPLSEKHSRDHALIQARLMAVRRDLLAGKAGAGREAGDELFVWFDRHFTTYDAALAFCMLQSSHYAGPGIPAVG